MTMFIGKSSDIIYNGPFFHGYVTVNNLRVQVALQTELSVVISPVNIYKP
jgi:hypothetical protein